MTVCAQEVTQRSYGEGPHTVTVFAPISRLKRGGNGLGPEGRMIRGARVRLHGFKAAVFGLLAVFAASCESPSYPKGGPPEGLIPLRITAITAGTAISTLVVQVTAADIPTALVFNLTVVNGVASGTIQIPPGPARTIAVTAFDAQGDITHDGSVTIDVHPGKNPSVQIKLRPHAGDVPITVTFGNFGVVVTPANASIDVSVAATVQLSVTVTDVNGQVLASPTVEWATTNPAVATVDATGLVSGVASGVATIVATYQGVAGVSAVTVSGVNALRWSPQTSGTTADLLGIWGSGPADAFAVGRAGTILHYDGTSWSPQISGTPEDLLGVWGSGPADVFAVGAGTILHYDGGVWSLQLSASIPIPLTGVWGSGPRDVYSTLGVPSFGLPIIHYDGSAWSQATTGPQFLLGVWGSGPADVFAAGVGGTILHYDGTSWSPQTSGTSQDLQGLWGSGPADVFAVGAGTILHYDGKGWTSQTIGAGATSTALMGVWGSGPADVFAAGAAGTILHYNGATWSLLASGTAQSLAGVWGSGAGDVFAVGGAGTILHGSP